MSLHEIQTKVHVAKDKKNEFGGYNYRTAEGILAAVKAALPDGWSIICTDHLQEIGAQIFVSATAQIRNSDGQPVAEALGHAMHPLQKKGMDPSQITGAASSYARKYALAGLLALDDGSVDPDATNNKNGAAGSIKPRNPYLLTIVEELGYSHEDDVPPETLHKAIAASMMNAIQGYKSEKGVDDYITKAKGLLDILYDNDRTLWEDVKETTVQRRDEIKEEKA